MATFRTPSSTSYDMLALLLTGAKEVASSLRALNQDIPEPIVPGTTITLTETMVVPSWTDRNPLDPFSRSYLQYWTARAMEALFDAPGSAMGVESPTFCPLGNDGKPGQCCNPTSDPFPSKPYFYRLPAGKSAENVAQDFGQDPESGWVQLRRANADDPDGFVKQDNEWCYWKVWKEGKILRIPGHWQESGFKSAVLKRLIYRDGSPADLKLVLSQILFFLHGIPSRWQTPLHMLLDCGSEVLTKESKYGLETDPLIAKVMNDRIIPRACGSIGQVFNKDPVKIGQNLQPNQDPVMKSRPVESNQDPALTGCFIDPNQNQDPVVKETSEPQNQDPAMKEKPVEPVAVLTDKTLQAFVDNNPVAVIKFFSTTCPACVEYGPEFKKAASKIKEAVFAEVNVREQPIASKYFKIDAIPTTFVVVNAQVKDKISGGMGTEQLVAWVRRSLP